VRKLGQSLAGLVMAIVDGHGEEIRKRASLQGHQALAMLKLGLDLEPSELLGLSPTTFFLTVKRSMVGEGHVLLRLEEDTLGCCLCGQTWPQDLGQRSEEVAERAFSRLAAEKCPEG